MIPAFVQSSGVILAQQARPAIGLDRLRRAQSRVAIAATPRQAEAQPLALGHPLPPLGVQSRPIGQLNGARRPGLAPGTAARGMLDPVEHGIEPEPVTRAPLDLDDLAQTAAPLSRPARAGPQIPCARS